MQDRDERVVPVALVQEHGLAALDGEFELPAERALLVFVRGEVAEVVEPAFAGGADFGRREQLAQPRQVARARSSLA